MASCSWCRPGRDRRVGKEMRPLETLLLVANLLTFFVFAVPLPRAVRWLRHLAPIALAIAVAQVLVEGPRWQMVPAYALSGLFFLVWLVQNIAPAFCFDHTATTEIYTLSLHDDLQIRPVRRKQRVADG